MTDFPCPAEVVDLLILGKRLPEGVQTMPPIPVPNLPHPITHSDEGEDQC